MHALSRTQKTLLVLLTLAWGINWPIMKIGVTSYPPLTFRAISMWIGLPVLALGLVLLKAPLRLPRSAWRELLWLGLTNMFVWHIAVLFVLRTLSSGRAAILGYTMPVFSALLGALIYRTPLAGRAWAGVAAAGLGVLLLLWHEITHMAGRPLGVLLALGAAAVWAIGTQELRRTKILQPAVTLTFWMTVLSAILLTVLALVFEGTQFRLPNAEATGAILYNGIIIFGFAQAIWFQLARNLPPIASTLSVMLIPVLGVFSGALWLGEQLHWQDWAAIVLMMGAIASVLWPAGRQAATYDGRRPTDA